MAVEEVGKLGAESWDEAPIERSFIKSVVPGILHFARRKPLGFICGVVVLFFFFLGDAVPETTNKISRTPVSIPGFDIWCCDVLPLISGGDVDIGTLSVPRIGTVKPDLGEPVPYLADQLASELPFVYDYARQDLRARLEGSSSGHLLGTDAIGRDIFSRLLYGARVAVMVAFGATFIAVGIGAVLGIMSGFYMGWVDKLVFRIVDAFQALPGLVVFIVILGVFNPGLWIIIAVLGSVFGPSQSRLVRGQTLSIMATPFIEAARVVGASDRRIMMRYVLPNVFHLIVLNATFLLGLMVLVEATLSFLGYGLPPPFPTWGQMLSLEGRQYMRTQPGLAIYPGIAIGILVFSFNLFGDALRDVLDPRLRGSR